jgi:hypothetical protein
MRLAKAVAVRNSRQINGSDHQDGRLPNLVFLARQAGVKLPIAGVQRQHAAATKDHFAAGGVDAYRNPALSELGGNTPCRILRMDGRQSSTGRTLQHRDNGAGDVSGKHLLRSPPGRQQIVPWHLRRLFTAIKKAHSPAQGSGLQAVP